LGASTKEQSFEEKKTWDGYGKFNDIPINPDVSKSQAEPRMSREEALKEKAEIDYRLHASSINKANSGGEK